MDEIDEVKGMDENGDPIEGEADTDDTEESAEDSETM